MTPSGREPAVGEGREPPDRHDRRSQGNGRLPNSADDGPADHAGTGGETQISTGAPDDHGGDGDTTSVAAVVGSLSATERRLRAQLAAHASWANTADRTARTAKAREAFDRQFEDQVDPDGVLSPEERARRAASLRKAHFARLAFKSAAARRKKR